MSTLKRSESARLKLSQTLKPSGIASSSTFHVSSTIPSPRAPSSSHVSSSANAAGASSISPAAQMIAKEPIAVGDYVLVTGTMKEGIVRYIGAVHFSSGIWVGIEMSTPNGKNDGSVQGTRYFTVAPLYGLFVRSAIVTKISPNSDREADNELQNSLADASEDNAFDNEAGKRAAAQQPSNIAIPSRSQSSNKASRSGTPTSVANSDSRRLSSDLPEPEDFNVPLRTILPSRRTAHPGHSSASIKPRDIDAGLVRLMHHRTPPADNGNKLRSTTPVQGSRMPPRSTSSVGARQGMMQALSSSSLQQSISSSIDTSSPGTRSATPLSEIYHDAPVPNNGSSSSSTMEGTVLFASSNPLKSAPRHISNSSGSGTINEDEIVMKVLSSELLAKKLQRLAGVSSSPIKADRESKDRSEEDSMRFTLLEQKMSALEDRLDDITTQCSQSHGMLEQILEESKTVSQQLSSANERSQADLLTQLAERDLHIKTLQANMQGILTLLGRAKDINTALINEQHLVSAST